MRRGAFLAAGALLLAAAPARAQLGEVQLGAVASYGAADAFKGGLGAVAGVAAGRLTYVGLRWTDYGGTMFVPSNTVDPTQVTNAVQTLAVDLGFMIPVGALEIVPGVSMGLAVFSQREQITTAGRDFTHHANELFAAPSLAVHVHVSRLVLIPETQYSLTGRPTLASSGTSEPSFPWPVTSRGWLMSLRLVVPIEVDRIRR